MSDIGVCPRCGHAGLRRLAAGAGGGPGRTVGGILGFLIWPGLAILCVVGFVPAVVVLGVLGVEPAPAALAIHLVVVGAALVAVLQWAIDRRRRRRAEERDAEGGRGAVSFCPWCETTLSRSRAEMTLATPRARL